MMKDDQIDQRSLSGECWFVNPKFRNSQAEIPYAAFAILPPLMQAVQTFIRRAPPCGRATRIDCKFGLNWRGVRLFA